MNNVKLADMTLLKGTKNLSFKDKIEIVRHLDNLKIDAIYMPQIENKVQDSVLIRTVSAFVKNSVLCATVGYTLEGVETAYEAIKTATNKRLVISMPVSAVQMEYFLHKKPAKALELIKELVQGAKQKVNDVEFICEDATRADTSYLKSAIELAIQCGANTVTICNYEGKMLPDEFYEYLIDLKKNIEGLDKVTLGVQISDLYDMSVAQAVLSIKAGAVEIKGACGDFGICNLEKLCSVIKNCGDKLNVTSNVNHVELNRTIRQIKWILGDKLSVESKGVIYSENNLAFSEADNKETVMEAVKKLGYDLSDQDQDRVYEEFKRVAVKKTITNKDLDAIVASVALQVPPVYTLKSYVINNGNIINSSAQITVIKGEKEFDAVAMGDGPIDAAFRAVEQVVGHKYELDDFQINAVTEGKEAVGSAIVRLRFNGKVYSGNGVSTDILGASIRAYINAVNKIVYEEENR